jgi:hypothetical protein
MICIESYDRDNTVADLTEYPVLWEVNNNFYFRDSEGILSHPSP